MDKPIEGGGIEGPARREFLDIEEVSGEIRKRVQRKSNRVDHQESPDSLLNGVFSSSESSIGEAFYPTPLTGTDNLWRDVLIKELLIGNLPPSPPTLRGRIGRTLVQLVQRCLFWLTPQVQTFQRQVAIAAKEQVTALHNLTGHVSHFDTRFAELDVQLLKQGMGSGTSRRSAAEAEIPRKDELVTLLATMGRQLSAEISARESLAIRTDAIVEDLQEIGSRVAVVEQSLSQIRQLEQYRRLTRSALTQPPQRLGTLSIDQTTDERATETQPLASSYLEFQDTFRGSYEDIKNRFTVHLGRLSPEQHGRSDAPLVDFGCGRGEWLSLLREHNFVAYGVDSDAGMVNFCSQRGLVVQQDDLLTHVSKLPEHSRGGVTAFHVIEHLAPAALERFLDAVLRVLIPGGILILETPNPANVFVGTRTFYLDPTHQKPLPSELVHYFLNTRGFANIQVIPLHPYPDGAKLNLPGNRAAEFIDEHFFGAQDYAVVCSKPLPL